MPLIAVVLAVLTGHDDRMDTRQVLGLVALAAVTMALVAVPSGCPPASGSP